MRTSRTTAANFKRCAVPVLIALFYSASVQADPVSPTTASSAATSSIASDAIERFLSERSLADLAAPAGLSAPGMAGRMRDKAADMVSTAMNFLGVRYRRGGTSADAGFDCSGFTRQVFEASIGRVLPRRADDQAKAPGLLPVRRDDLQPGDLVFFNTLRRTFSHVGIYVGEGKFIHAPRPGGEVRVEDMRFVYWAKRFTGGRRAEPIAEPMPVATVALPPPATAAPTESSSAAQHAY